MPRKLLIRTNQFSYHVTSRCNNREWFKIPMPLVWKHSLDSIKLAHEKHVANIHLFVLMNNHYHLILDTPKSNIDLFMYEFNKAFACRLRNASNRINRVFGARYSWSLIIENVYYYNVLKYVALNPVKANLAEKVQDYRYSTLYHEHKNLLTFPLKPYIDMSRSDFLAWVNQNHSKEQNESIKKGLIRSKFQFTGSREIRSAPQFHSFEI